ncbi:MAG: FGGY family carbohydrate kinase [Bacteroidota bacterium]|nr:FGGY family carbohydrate kinase [Bacteroidota bacterium]
MKKVTAIFDIGKTNKKFFLFDENYQEVFKEYITIEEIKDDDGLACDCLQAIEKWMKDILRAVLNDEKFEVTAINFSTYGASLVHVDEQGNAITPIYNYLNPYPENILRSFHEKYGHEMKIAMETASPPLGMLNSGLQLYWLKYAKPGIFKKIKWSFHLPQYMAFLFSGTPVSEYTSIGCHTGLWDYRKNDYHRWVYAEGIDKILPPVFSTDTVFKKDIEGKSLKIGSGIHDSSAALMPYMLSSEDPFLLISTGTWSISLNPFSTEMLTEEDLRNDCLNFLQADGKPVRASRLLLGNEYDLQIEKLSNHFHKEKKYHKTVKFYNTIFEKWIRQDKPCFYFENLLVPAKQEHATDYTPFENFEEAYHKLMIELMGLQVQSALRAIGNTSIKKIYVDGGFADNDLYIKILAHHFPKYEIYTTQSPLGSALGAAMIISDKKPGSNFLKEHYAMKKHSV